MSFDIDSVLGDMASTLTATVSEGTGDMRAFAEQVLAGHRNSLAELAEARINGWIDDGTFEREVERERTVLETELLTLETMGRATAQRAVNDTVAVFARAVRGLIAG